MIGNCGCSILLIGLRVMYTAHWDIWTQQNESFETFITTAYNAPILINTVTTHKANIDRIRFHARGNLVIIRVAFQHVFIKLVATTKSILNLNFHTKCTKWTGLALLIHYGARVVYVLIGTRSATILSSEQGSKLSLSIEKGLSLWSKRVSWGVWVTLSWTYLKKSALQNSFPSREKHLSVSLDLHSQQCTHFTCHGRSRTFNRNRSKMGPLQPAHICTMLTAAVLRDDWAGGAVVNARWSPLLLTGTLLRVRRILVSRSAVAMVGNFLLPKLVK